MGKKVKVGDVFKTSGGGFVEVVSLVGSSHLEVKSLNEEGGIYKVGKKAIKNSTARDPYKRTVLGVGYLGVGEYKATENCKSTKAHAAWLGAMSRCYSDCFQRKCTTYEGCTVSKEWHNFQKFAHWYYNQVGWQENYHLDKDILVKGNKVYSAETCCLVPPEINSLFQVYSIKKSGLPVGVFNHRNNRFKSMVKIDDSEVFLGVYDTIEEAKRAYSSVKNMYVKLKVEKYKGKISDIAYNTIYNYDWG